MPGTEPGTYLCGRQGVPSTGNLLIVGIFCKLANNHCRTRGFLLLRFAPSHPPPPTPPGPLSAYNTISVGDPCHFGADPDPRIRTLWLMDPDPTPFLHWFLGCKKKYFFYNLRTGTSFQSKKFKFLLKYCVKIFICRQSFSPLNMFMRKGKDPYTYIHGYMGYMVIGVEGLR